MAPTEQWRPVPDFPDYRVSNLGRIVSLRRKEPHILRPSISSGGYLSVSLTRPVGGQTTHSVHRLVVAAFIGPRPSGMHIRHLDGDPRNAALANLTYGTASENAQDTVRHGRHHASRRTACIRGHALSGANLYITPGGSRRCRTCHRDRQRTYDRLALRAAGIEASA